MQKFNCNIGEASNMTFSPAINPSKIPARYMQKEKRTGSHPIDLFLHFYVEKFKRTKKNVSGKNYPFLFTFLQIMDQGKIH